MSWLTGKEAKQDMRLQSTLESCATNIMIADEHYNIVYMNKSMTELMSNAEQDLRKELPAFDSRNLIGTSIDKFHKDPSHQRRILDSLNKPTEARLKLGGRELHLIITPVFDENGKKRVG